MKPTLSAQEIYDEQPHLLRRWVAVASVLTGLAYLAVWVAAFVPDPTLWSIHSKKLLVVGICVVSLLLTLRERPLVGVYLILAVVWLELHSSYLVSLRGISAAASMAVGAFVLLSGLLAGGRAALGLAALCTLTVPLALWLGPGPPLLAQLGDLVVLLAVVWGTAGMLYVFQVAFRQVFDSRQDTMKRMTDLVDGLPDGLVGLDEEWRVVAVNPAASAVFDTSAEGLLGARFEELFEETDGLEGLERRSSSESPLILSPAQSERRVEVRVRPARIDQSQGYLAVLRDVTRRLEAEERAQELQGQLQHAQKLEAVGQLAGGVAHDFANVLTAVGACAELLSTESSEVVRELAGDLKAAQQSGTALTHQLLAFARKEEVAVSTFDAAETLLGIEQLVRHLLDERTSLSLVTEGRCLVSMDQHQLQQVILNLVANARDAMPGGGKLRVAVRASQGRVLVEVSDTGCGMEPELIERIFEPFYTTKPRGKGTGLGLSMVHGIIVGAGGRVDVESEPGQGTTFRLVLPRAERPDDTTGELTVPAEVRHAGSRILLVEDESITRRFTTRLLRRQGYDVTVAVDGPEALRLFGRTQPHLLLTDVGLPGMDGIAVASRARALDPEIQVLFLTGYLDRALDDSPFDTFEDLILKPFGTEDLLARVSSKLDRARARESLEG